MASLGCSTTMQSKEHGWKPSAYRARASSRPYLWEPRGVIPKATRPQSSDGRREPSRRGEANSLKRKDLSLVGVAGFEPATTRTPSEKDDK